MGYYATKSGLKPTFRDYLSVPSSRVKLSKNAWNLRVRGYIGKGMSGRCVSRERGGGEEKKEFISGEGAA
jgi:hypothetical protein